MCRHQVLRNAVVPCERRQIRSPYFALRDARQRLNCTARAFPNRQSPPFCRHGRRAIEIAVCALVRSGLSLLSSVHLRCERTKRCLHLPRIGNYTRGHCIACKGRIPECWRRGIRCREIIGGPICIHLYDVESTHRLAPRNTAELTTPSGNYPWDANT